MLFLVLEHRTKDPILKTTLFFLEQGRTILDYNSNITTRLISTKKWEVVY